MKTKLLLLLITILASTNIHSQCSTSAFSFGNNNNIAMYNVSGDVDITLNTDNTVTLNLGDNFSTAAGPDIRAFFVASNGASNSDLTNSLINDLENFEFGLVGAIGSVNQNGAKTFTVAIPDAVDIMNYDRILFYCLQFNQFWDFGEITAFSSTNCSILDVEENVLSQTVDFYPNPSNDIIEITNDNTLNIDLEIYSVLGNTILEVNNLVLRKQTIDVSSLKSGVYLVQLKTDGQSMTKRLIKR